MGLKLRASPARSFRRGNLAPLCVRTTVLNHRCINKLVFFKYAKSNFTISAFFLFLFLLSGSRESRARGHSVREGDLTDVNVENDGVFRLKPFFLRFHSSPGGAAASRASSMASSLPSRLDVTHFSSETQLFFLLE